MPSTTIYTTKDASAIDAEVSNWSGSDQHHPVGRLVDGSFKARSVIYFPISFSGMQNITQAVLWLRGSKSGASHASGNTSSKTMFVRRQLRTWREDSATTEGIWSNRDNNYNDLTNSTTINQSTKQFSSGITDGTWYSIDVTPIVVDWKLGQANHGFLLVNNDQENANDGIEFYSREKGSAYRPYLVITYGSNTAPNAPVSLSPTGDAVVPSLKPSLSATFSDPDAGDSMSGYQILFYADDGTTLLWDTGTISATASSFSKAYAGPALSYGTFYKWKVRTKDGSGTWGPYSSLQRFQVVDADEGGTPGDPDTPPVAIVDLSASPGDTSITLDWAASTEDLAEFDHYQVYRRELGEEEWEELASIYDRDTPTFEDLTPQFGVQYEYKVTQFKNITGGFDVESPDSDTVTATLEGEARDEWSVLGADGLSEHSFDLPVTDAPINTPIQQEVFEPLGSRRKTVVRGRVLGAEGTLSCEWEAAERNTALNQIDYITSNRGPHVLRSPFGDVWLVEFSGPSRKDLPGGHLQIDIAWTEVA